MQARPLAIIMTGHAPATIRSRHGDFDHWFRVGMRLPRTAVRVIDAIGGEALPEPRQLAGAVLTGSAAMVTEHLPWSEQVAGWIRAAMDADLPLLGVCYGHQLMTYALGGVVGKLPAGREIGTCRIDLLEGAAQDPLLCTLPAHFAAHTTHVQAALELPPGARALARSELDPHHVVRYGEHAWSTQLHPELSTAVMSGFIRSRMAALRAEGLDPLALLRGVHATPVGRHILRRFAALAFAAADGDPRAKVS